MADKTTIDIQKPRYRTPLIMSDAEVAVRLDDFSKEKIREYLKEEGEEFVPEKLRSVIERELLLTVEDINRIDTLAVAGQKAYAREYLCELVSRHIKRVV